MRGKMSASEYLTKHWTKNKVWRNLKTPRHQERFRMCANLTIGEQVIDVGCALGHSTAWLRKKNPSVHWSGLDFDEATISAAKILFPKIAFYYAPSIKAFADENERAFDSVVCSEVIEHVADDAEFVHRLKRIARHRVILTTPGRAVNDPGHLRLYDEAMLRELCAPDPCEIMRGKIHPFFFYVVINLSSRLDGDQ